MNRDQIIETMARGMREHSYPKGATSRVAIMIRQAAQAALQALEAGGFVVVPRCPSPDMLSDGVISTNRLIGVSDVWDIWSAMLASRDQSPSTTVATPKSAAADEIADLKSSVIAFCAPFAVSYAKDHGFPPGHLHPGHYDILERCSARMVDFTRAEIAADHQGEEP